MVLRHTCPRKRDASMPLEIIHSFDITRIARILAGFAKDTMMEEIEALALICTLPPSERWCMVIDLESSNPGTGIKIVALWETDVVSRINEIWNHYMIY